MSTATTIAGQGSVVKVAMPPSSGLSVTAGTFLADFDAISDGLSSKPLRRPSRSRPLPELTNDLLKRLAKNHRPDDEWFEGETECPFK